MEIIVIKHATPIIKIVVNVIGMEFAFLVKIINFLEIIAVKVVKNVQMEHVIWMEHAWLKVYVQRVFIMEKVVIIVVKKIAHQMEHVIWKENAQNALMNHFMEINVNIIV
jgi:hypothetical protein